MDTSDLMMAHLESRIHSLRNRDVFTMGKPEQIYRLEELEMMLEVLRNANNLARLANDGNRAIAQPDPEIKFEGVKPK